VHSMTLSAGILDERFQKRQRSMHRFAQCFGDKADVSGLRVVPETNMGHGD